MARERDFSIIIDTREQLPFDLAVYCPVQPGTLSEGDYTVAGLEDRVTIERKSGSDLYGCMTTSRERFERELERLRQYEFSAVVCECLESDLLSGRFGKMKPRAMKATLTAWEIRFPTKWIFCPSRVWAGRTTYLLLERFHRDVQSGKRLQAAGEAVPA